MFRETTSPNCFADGPILSKAPSSNSCNLAVVCGAEVPLKNFGKVVIILIIIIISSNIIVTMVVTNPLWFMIMLILIILIFMTNALDWRLISWNYQPSHRHPFARWTVIKIRSKRLVRRRVKWETLGSALKDQWRCFIHDIRWDM